MATQEKLLKSLDFLRSINSSSTSETPTRKKEKIHHCNVITEAMSNPTIRIAPNFGYMFSCAIEAFLKLCDDPESDVRMFAEECLNRLIRVMSNGNMSKIQIELHKEIKKNGAPRSLRAALWRFSELSHHIRPHKGKPYVTNLLPSIIRITEREEELIHDTLANSLPKIMISLGCFTTDNDVKALLKAFLANISNSSAAVRRNNISCILTTCLHCRKPYVFITYILNTLLDLLIPIQESNSPCLILGTMASLKAILPHINNSENEHEIKDSFGARKEVNETPFAIDRLLQVYELCLHYFLDNDHNIVNVSLETLNVLLQNSSMDLKNALLSLNGLTKSRILCYDSGSRLRQRSPSQLSVATTSLSGEDNFENDLLDSIKPDIEKWIDQSKLSVMNVTYARTSEAFNKTKSSDNIDQVDKGVVQEADYSNMSIGTITEDFSDNGKAGTVLYGNVDKQMSDTSSEHSFTHNTCDKSITTVCTDIIYQEIDVGDFRDKDIPLLYCARLITKLFLLTGHPNKTTSDKAVRVSVKSLSLACLATIFQVCPQIFLRYLDKNHTAKDIKLSKQQLSDVLLFKDHTDPQLRGAIRVLIGNFIKAVLIKSYGNYDGWIEENNCVEDQKTFDLDNLIQIIVAGLEDESSNCSKQSLQSLNICLKFLIESKYSLSAKSILNVLPLVAKNPYWLVKATLVEVIADLNYVTLNYVTGSSKFQDKVLHNILFELLKDDNQRVRNACSTALVQIIPLLHYKQHFPNEMLITRKAKHFKKLYMSNLFQNLDSNSNKHFIKSMPFPFSLIGEEVDEEVNQSLSRIITQLSNFLLITSSKHFVHGCIETLCALSISYPPTVYFEAWNCFNASIVNLEIKTLKNLKKEVCLSSSMGLFSACVSFLCNGSIAYDLNCHLNLLKLGGNIFAGLAVKNLKPKADINLDENNQLWGIFTDNSLSNLSEQFFIHLLKLLNIFCHVLDEITPSQPQNKPVLPHLPSATALSPLKRRKSDLGERAKSASIGKAIEKDDKGEKRTENFKTNLMGYFANSPHYLKMYDLLKTAYINYKTTLDSEASEKFLNLLCTSLQTLSKFLELATLFESGRVSEEILNYFRSTFNFEPSSTVECVQQLLRSLFGTNLTCNFWDISSNTKPEEKQNEDLFYHSVFQTTYNDVVRCFNEFHSSSKIDRDSDKVVMGYLHRRESKVAVLPRGADKILSNYIRLFEPMVIKSLKQYTITSDVKLQCKVLQLLCQLVQLRVNYCLLDSEQIFINFVLKQFEYIEEGQILYSNELIPCLFNFLVQLSYGKQHSKSIISVPKIIQLCDGLMASGQPPLANCIPALEQVIEDIFLFRNKSNTTDFKELETMREFLLSMLLRLLEYSSVISMLTVILNESKYCNDNCDKWLKWSKQVCDIFLPMLKRNSVAIDNKYDLISVRKLIFALNPSVFKPLNDVLLVLFDDPPHEGNTLQVNRWFSKIIILLLVVSKSKEELLLLKIGEVKGMFVPQSVFRYASITADPLNVTNTSKVLDNIQAECVFVRFIFRTIDIVVNHCVGLIGSQKDLFLIEQLSSFLLFCLHIFQSGSHCKIANTAIELINKNSQCSDNHEEIPIEGINENMLKLNIIFPTVTFEWCYLLTLLNYNNQKFWSKIINIEDPFNELVGCCINLEIVRVGGVIVFCDYLTENTANEEQLLWFLVNNIKLLIFLCDEEPVNEFLSSLHRNPSTSGLVIQSISTQCLPIIEPTFRRKILKSIENVHSSQIGKLLSLLLPKLLDCKHLALSRLASNLTSRKIELLLTLSMEEVHLQLPKTDLIKIFDCLSKTQLIKKYETLVSLLNKLATQYYDLTPLEVSQKRTINPDYVKKLEINKAWYVSQVKSKCCCTSVGSEMSELLSYLEYENLLDIMEDQNFNKTILNQCMVWCKNKIVAENVDQDLPLMKATTNTLIKNVKFVKTLLPTSHEVYKVTERFELPEETKFSNELTHIFLDNTNWSLIYEIIPSVTCFFETYPYFKHLTTSYDDLVIFSVICLESTSFLIENENDLNLSSFDSALNCTKVVAESVFFSEILNQKANFSWLCSSVNSIYKIVSYLLIGNESLPDIPKYGFSNTSDNLTVIASHACHQLSILVCWLEKTQNSVVEIPKCLLTSIKSIIISLSRLPLVNSYLLTPPSAWKNGLTSELSGTYNTQVSSLPIEFLQEVDILEEFIFRITLLGWTSRQQFEETWMCLLSVLSSNIGDLSTSEEINAVSHVTSLAVQAITSLLLQTLCTPILGNRNVSKFLHVSRDGSIKEDNMSVKKLKNVHNKLQYKFNEYSKSFKSGDSLMNVFEKPNLEKLGDEYSFNQLSVEYLLVSAKIVEVVNETSAVGIYRKAQQRLTESGLDLNSCIQFLIDLYTQWIKSQSTPLRILHEVVKSLLVISDLFTEKSQFSWMLDVCLDLSKSHSNEDELLHQYLVIGVCKAVAALTPNLETYETVKKLLTQNLKSGFIPSKIASLHGILYILESCFLSNTYIGGLSEELQLIFAVAIDYIQCHINSNISVLNQSIEHTLLFWAIVFYLIENVEESNFSSNFVSTALQSAINCISYQKVSAVSNALLKGLERLVIKRNITGKNCDQLYKLALEKMKHGHPSTSFPAIQLLLTCIYTNSTIQLENPNQSNGSVQSNPDDLVQTIEKITAIFDHIKKGYPAEVETLCFVLPDILNDFFPPSDILTKVIGEFLSPQQPHPKLLSRVVFQVFQCAIGQSQLSLLQDWVVFSLSNFTQSSVGMSIWCLTCFFISASTNKWLRSLFPYVQSRIGRYEYEDRQMLCVAGADFYKHLVNDKQRETFVETFTKVKHQVDSPFQDLLASL